MKESFNYLIFLHIFHCVHTEQTNEILKKEIEAVAAESRSLAAELADMLLKLEVQDLREKAVEAAVVGDHENVKTVLDKMVARLHDIKDEDAMKDKNKNEKIRNTTSDTADSYEKPEIDSNHKVLGSQPENEMKSNSKEHKSNQDVPIADHVKVTKLPKIIIANSYNKYENLETKTEKLEYHLNSLENVAKEIQKLAFSAKSEEDINFVNQLTEIFDSMAEELSVDEITISLDLNLEKRGKLEKMEKNIEKMLDLLVTVVKEFREARQKKQIAAINRILEESDKITMKKLDKHKGVKEPRISGSQTEDKKPIHSLRINEIKDTRQPSETKNPVIIRRKSKQLDDGLITDDSDDKDNDDDKEGKVESDDCQDSVARSRVSVCVPTFHVKHKDVKFYSKAKKESKHCFNV